MNHIKYPKRNVGTLNLFIISTKHSIFSQMKLILSEEIKMAKQIRPVISHTNALRDFNIVLTMQKMIQRHQYTFLVFSKVIWRLTPDNHFITRYIMHISFNNIIVNFIDFY